MSEILKKFKISNLDSNAQGVSKIDGEIIFIPKTLPGEEGICEITAKKSKVSFANAKEIQKKSELRNKSECTHYSECGGCDYLHTSYEQELIYKTESLKDIFTRQHKIHLERDPIVHKCESRFSYRNRIQLHYDSKKNKIGFISNKKNIFQLEKCHLVNNEISAEVSRTIKDWKQIVKKNKPRGHIEIYAKDGELKTSVNQRYSSGGFSQVNSKMNDELHKSLLKYFNENNFEHVLDLFGGEGNITKNCNAEEIYVVDGTPHKFINLKRENQSYHEVDLYKNDAIERVKKITANTIDCLIFDPPRSGFKDIDQLAEYYTPEKILYVSCNPQTLGRDLGKIQNKYNLDSLHLYDFFPSTKHYETVAFLSLKS